MTPAQAKQALRHRRGDRRDHHPSRTSSNSSGASATSPALKFETTHGALGARVTQQMQALVYNLNSKLQETYVKKAIGYIDVIRNGGQFGLLGQNLQRARHRRRAEDDRGREEQPRPPKLLAFLDTPRRYALDFSQKSAQVVAQPIKLETKTRERPQLAVLGPDAGLRASADDEHPGAGARRRRHGLRARRERRLPARARAGLEACRCSRPRSLLATIISFALGLVLLLAFGSIVDLADISGGQPWSGCRWCWWA